MLTPGTEYFAADSDTEALAIAHGTAVAAERARLDGLHPIADLPFFLALLTRRREDEVHASAPWTEVDVEHRASMQIRVLRADASVAAAWAAATEGELRALAERIERLWGFPDLAPRLAADLERLAAVAAHGPLYARVIEASSAAESPAPRSLGRRAYLLAAIPYLLAPAGLAMLLGGGSTLTSVIGFFLACLAPLAGSVAIGAVRARRLAQRETAILRDADAMLSVTAVISPDVVAVLLEAHSQLPGAAAPTIEGRGRLSRVLVDPSGIRIPLGGTVPLQFPVASIRAVGTGAVYPQLAAVDAVGQTAELRLAVAVSDDETVLVGVPLLADTDKLDPEVGRVVVARIADVLGVPAL